jgi:hypothetical protein
VSDALVGDLGLPPEVWLFLTVLSCLVLFFKFGRFWSVRNLDLLLLYAQTPGLVRLVGRTESQSFVAFLWLFAGATIWIFRCFVDLGLTRRPLLEPNMNSGGLALFMTGLLGLVLVETLILPEPSGMARNPADPHADQAGRDLAGTVSGSGTERVVGQVLSKAPPASELKRVAAAIGHLGIVVGLVMIGWRNFERPVIGFAMGVCYLILPYSRIALLDSGQLVPASLVVLAVLAYRQPIVSGSLIGVASAWMPAVIAIVPLWTGFYWRRGARRFVAAVCVLLLTGAILGWSLPVFAAWAQALGSRTLAEAGLLWNSGAPSAGSFWAFVEPAYRLPVLVVYTAVALVCAYWPAGKDLAHMIALSAVLLVGSQFWYLDEGGTHVVLYLPLIILIVFRPNLQMKRPSEIPRRAPEESSAFATV